MLNNPVCNDTFFVYIHFCPFGQLNSTLKAASISSLSSQLFFTKCVFLI